MPTSSPVSTMSSVHPSPDGLLQKPLMAYSTTVTGNFDFPFGFVFLNFKSAKTHSHPRACFLSFPMLKERVILLAAALLVAGLLAHPPSATAETVQDLLGKLVSRQEASPDDPAAIGQLAMYYHAHEQYAQALDWYQQARNLDRGNWRWPYLTGLALVESARAGDAEAPLRDAFAMAPQQAAIGVNLGRALINLGRLEEAGEILQRAQSENPQSAPVLAELGIVALAQGHFDSAIEHLRGALAIDPGASRLFHPLASALRASGNRAGAREALAQAGNIAPRLSDPVADEMRALSQSYAFYMSQGLLAAANADWRSARTLLERAVAANPQSAVVGVNFARVLESAGDKAAAEQELHRVLQHNPKHAPALFNLGALAELVGDDEGALDYYQASLALDPEDFPTRLLAGSAALRLDQMTVAAGHFAAAARLKPERDELLVQLAVAQWADNCEAAIDTALNLVQRRPQDPAAAALYVRLASNCPGAPDQARINALNAAGNLSRLNPGPAMQISVAMAEAATGNFGRAAQVHEAAQTALEPSLTPDQRQSLSELLANYRDRRPANRPFVLNEQVLKPPRLTPAERR